MIELEKTYLAKHIPLDLEKCPHKEIIDVYFPKTSIHPVLRLRKNGSKYEITKKQPILEGDASRQKESTIMLTKEEFDALSGLDGKRIHKIRYYYDYEDLKAEFDVFQESLAGLVMVDFEFQSVEDKDKFIMPDFCLADVTQEKFLAGGMVCGKSYDDLVTDLNRFDYKKLS